MTFLVLFVARLLADDHHARAGSTLTKDRLGAHHPELAAATTARRFAQRAQRGPRRNEVLRRARGDRQLDARRHVQVLSPSWGTRACDRTLGSAAPRRISRNASTFSLFFSASSCCCRS